MKNLEAHPGSKFAIKLFFVSVKSLLLVALEAFSVTSRTGMRSSFATAIPVP